MEALSESWSVWENHWIRKRYQGHRAVGNGRALHRRLCKALEAEVPGNPRILRSPICSGVSRTLTHGNCCGTEHPGQAGFSSAEPTKMRRS